MDWEQSRAYVRKLIEDAAGGGDTDFAKKVKSAAKGLRDRREFDLLDQFAEELRQRGPTDPEIVKLQAQTFIDRGKPGTALVLLEAIANSDQFVEAHGLMGRAWKQIFFDAQDKTSELAKQALAKSFNQYKIAYGGEPGGNVWVGLNMLALAAFANRQGIQIPLDIEIPSWADKLLKSLEALPTAQQDNWYHASAAEAYLGKDDLDSAQKHIGTYVQSPDTTAFALAGTLRQFTDLWQLDKRGDQGMGIIQALRAALLKKTDGLLDLTPEQVSKALMGAKPPRNQLEAILGRDGLETYEWLRTGFERARAVGVIRTLADGRIGTGFLVAAKNFIPSAEAEFLVMTNAHVVSDAPEDRPAAHAEDAQIIFEAVDKGKEYEFTEVVWRSPVPHLDCALLRLSEQPQGIEPLPFDKVLPPNDFQQRVYVIGYPGGRDLAFSLQDNLLVDHEGAPGGQPPDPLVCRLQYRAPTAPGSSGSPVFSAKGWKVLALHHAGSESMPKLNGKAGRWPANEGIWIQSILAACPAAAQPKATPASGGA
jgi:V8-like Glu-specific endopeptidase